MPLPVSAPARAHRVRATAASAADCQPGVRASVPKTPASVGTPHAWASSTPTTYAISLSQAVARWAPVRGSIIPVIREWKTGAPGWTSWSRTRAATISASPATTVPGIVAGPVDPAAAIDMKPTGIPASARTRAPSIPSSSWASGAIVQMRAESGGRARSVASSPARTRAISTAERAGRAPMTVSVWTCLTVLAYDASSSWSGAVRGWSWALSMGQ